MLVIGSSPYSLRIVPEDVQRMASAQGLQEEIGDASTQEAGGLRVAAGADELREEEDEIVGGGDRGGMSNGGRGVGSNRGSGEVASDDGGHADRVSAGVDGATMDNGRSSRQEEAVLEGVAADDAAASPSAGASSAFASIAATASPARRRRLPVGNAGPPNGASPRPPRSEERAVAANLLPVDEDTLMVAFLRELRVAVNLTARMASAQAVSCVCVHGAQVLVSVEAFDPVTTWTWYKNGMLLALCSCAGVLGLGRSSIRGLPMEFAQMEAALGRSCTCRHAMALLRAIDELGRDVGATCMTDLFTACPALLGPLGDDDDGCQVGTITYQALHTGKRNNVPIHVVFYNDAWAPVVVRPTANKFKLATCFQLPCQTRPWGCIHAKAVNKVTRADASSAAARAEMDRQDELECGPDGLLNEQEAAPGLPPASAPPPRVPLPASAPAPPRKRRARNMFPCASEVAMCDSYSAALDALRDAKLDRQLFPVHAEESCLDCGEKRDGKNVSAWAAVLHTMRGRLQINVGNWTCSKGHIVDYDGAEDGLFAMSPETLYVRVFLDAVLGICVIGRSTMAAASEYLTSLLRNSGAYQEGEQGQARQLLSDACGEFSETLVIPDVAFHCGKCSEEEADDGRFDCVLMDGQVLAVLQEHIMPMVRPGMDAPRADLAITYACAVRNATVRAVIRHRIRSGADDAVALTADEARKFKAFAMQPFTERPAPPPPPTESSRGMRTPTDAEAALQWSAFKLFSTFFHVPNIESVPNAPTAAAAVARREGAAAEGSTDGEDESVVDMVSPIGSSNGTASEYSSDELTRFPQGSSSDSEIGDGEDHLTVLFSNPPLAAAGAVAPVGEDGQVVVEDAVGAARDDGRAGVEEELQALELDASAPMGSRFAPSGALAPSMPLPMGDDATLAPSTPPSIGDDGELPLATTSRVDGEDEWPAVESIFASVPRTRCKWKVPLASVQPQPTEPGSDENHVVEDPANPESLLTQAAMERVNSIFKKKRTGDLLPVIKLGAIPIYVSNLHNLSPGRWLDDECMNGYIWLLQARHRTALGVNPAAAKLYFFNTFFFKRLMFLDEYSYDVVRRWTKNVDIFAMDTIFIPINLRLHWFLVVVYVGTDDGTVSVYDSLGSPDGSIPTSIRE